MNIKDLDPSKIQRVESSQPLNVKDIIKNRIAVKRGDPNFQPVPEPPKQGVASYLPGELLKTGGDVVKEGLTSMASTIIRNVAIPSNPLLSAAAPILPEKVETPIGEIELKPSQEPVERLKQGGEDILNVAGGTGAAKTSERTLKPLLTVAEKIAAKKAEQKLAQEALKAVSLETKFMTKGEKEAAKKTASGIFKGGEPVVSNEDKRLATKFKNFLGKGSNIEKENAMKDFLSKTGQETEAYLTQNNFTFTDAKLRDAIMSALNKVFPAGVKDTTKKEVIDTLMSKVDKNTMSELWKGRTRFDHAIDSVFGSEQMAAGDIKKATRDAVNQFIEDGIPDSLYKAKLKDMSDAYRVLDRLSPKAGKELGVSKFRQVIEEHPFIKDVLKKTLVGAGTVAAGLFGYKELKDLLGD